MTWYCNVMHLRIKKNFLGLSNSLFYLCFILILIFNVAIMPAPSRNFLWVHQHMCITQNRSPCVHEIWNDACGPKTWTPV